jgi:hypothetical protein
MRIRELVSNLIEDIESSIWVALSIPLLALICFGHYLSKFNLLLCRAYMDILKEIKHEGTLNRED